MLDQLLEFDRSLFLYLNNLGTPSWDGFWVVVTNKLTFIPLYLVLIYLMAKRLTVQSGCHFSSYNCWDDLIYRSDYKPV